MKSGSRAPGAVVAVLLTLNLGVGATLIAGRDAEARPPAATSPAGPSAPVAETATRPQGAPMFVSGRAIPGRGLHTVGDALARAGVVPRHGRLLAVVDSRVLDARAFPATFLLNGRRAKLSTPVLPGGTLRVINGRDRVEDTETVRLVTAADPTRTGLYVGGRSGLVIQTVGEQSGQVVRSRVVRERKIGRLKAPGAVALTFDDGPDPRWTRKVLALLAEHDVQAVFCQIGRSVKAHPDVVRAVVAGGHLLCNHTMGHDESLRHRKPKQIRADIHRTSVAIRRASGGVAPMFFRAPGGNWSTKLQRIARAEQLTPLQWTADPRDWTKPRAGAIVRRVLDELRPGGVVLLHDGGGRRGQTLKALDRLLTKLPKLGYRFTLPSP